MKLNEIETKELELQNQMKELRKQKEIAMVKEDKAYLCKKCNTFVDKGDIGPSSREAGLCSNCFNRKWHEDREKEINSKLKFARIIDIEIVNIDEIKQLRVYKNGMVYDLKAEYDRDFDDRALIVIDNEEKSKDMELDIVEEIKPWQKPRQEKPLQQ